MRTFRIISICVAAASVFSAQIAQADSMAAINGGSLTAGSAHSFSWGIKALSMQDMTHVVSLLKAFDPNSFHIQAPYVDSAGKIETYSAGKGMVDLRQSNTFIYNKGYAMSTNTNINIFSSRVASTNTNINIFASNKLASTNTNINIFANRMASTNTNINIFSRQQQADGNELGQVLSHYVSQP